MTPPSLLLPTPASLADMPAPDPAARVDSLPAPESTLQRPSVERFESIAAGDAVLLRLITRPVIAPECALLLVDHGDEIDVLDPLPSSMTGGALGFACERRTLEAQPAFWLQSGRLSLALPGPAPRALE